MGYFRFRRSIKIFDWLSLNINKKSFSVTAGVKGAHFTVGSTGANLSLGIPGTGLSYHEHASYNPTYICPGCGCNTKHAGLCGRCYKLYCRYGTTDRQAILWQKQANKKCVNCPRCQRRMYKLYSSCPDCGYPLSSSMFPTSFVVAASLNDEKTKSRKEEKKRTKASPFELINKDVRLSKSNETFTQEKAPQGKSNQEKAREAEKRRLSQETHEALNAEKTKKREERRLANQALYAWEMEEIERTKRENKTIIKNSLDIDSAFEKKKIQSVINKNSKSILHNDGVILSVSEGVNLTYLEMLIGLQKRHLPIVNNINCAYTTCPCCGNKLRISADTCTYCNYPVKAWAKTFSKEDSYYQKVKLTLDNED